MAKKRVVTVDWPADRLIDIDDLASGPVRLLSAKAVLSEFDTFSRALNLPAALPHAVHMEEEDWNDLMSRLQPHLSPAATGSGRLPDLSEDETSFLGFRLSQARLAVAHAERLADTHGSATGFLLPVEPAVWIEMILGYGALPVAWVRRVDVLEFP